MRSEAREAALKVLFAEQFNNENLFELQNRLLKNFKEEDTEFAKSLVACVNEHRDELLREIDSHILNFKENRLYTVDKCIMLIAVAEIKYFDDIPSVVSVNEATNLANKYSTERSADFVNGVLAGIIK